MRMRDRVTMAVAAEESMGAFKAVVATMTKEEESMGASKAVVAKATGHGMNNYFCLSIAAVTSFSP